MRIALITATAKPQAAADWAKALAKGMEAMGHRVDLLDARQDDGVRLPGYEYVAVLAESISFFGGKMPDSLAKMLGNASSLVGKKGAAFLRKRGPFTGKAMANLMRAMEKEGMCVNWSEIIERIDQAEALGKRIGN
jgi:hypothetical protein